MTARAGYLQLIVNAGTGVTVWVTRDVLFLLSMYIAFTHTVLLSKRVDFGLSHIYSNIFSHTRSKNFKLFLEVPTHVGYVCSDL